jgi:hypothetical protein
VPIEGIPRGLELEAVTSMGSGRFAVGTEAANADRPSDKIFLVQVSGTRAHVDDVIDLPYSGLPIAATANHGIEGLCWADGHLFAAFEQPLVSPAGRFAVLVHRNPSGHLHTSTLALTTATGKVSGLDCRLTTDGADVIAIERHFGVRRVLAFAYSFARAAASKPRVVRDLNNVLPANANPEGIAWDGAAFVVILDNHYRVRTGPCELLRFSEGQ